MTSRFYEEVTQTNRGYRDVTPRFVPLDVEMNIMQSISTGKKKVARHVQPRK